MHAVQIFQRGSKYFEIFGPGGPYILRVQIFCDSSQTLPVWAGRERGGNRGKTEGLVNN